MTPDNKYSEVLLELKTHYQQTLAELEAQTNQIKTRLTSLDTLIEDPLLGSDLLSVLQGEADSVTPATPASQAAEEAKPEVETQSQPTTPKTSPSTSKKKPSTSKKTTSQAKKKKTQKKKSSPSSSSRPMQWPYTDMYKIDAVKKIMGENAGKVMHIDDLILQLYGELSGDDLKTERDRISNTMYTGVQQERWRKDSKEPMSYILEEKSETKSEKT